MSTTTTTKISMVKYNRAVTAGRKANTAAGKAAWIIGDLAASVTVDYGENTMQRYADDIGTAYKTLLNYRTVAGAYAVSDRSESNTFTVHEIFAPLDDRVALAASKAWTVREARELVKARKTDNNAPASDESGENELTGNAPMSELEKARANVQRLQGELQAALVKLAKLEAEESAPAAPKAPAKAPAKVTTHTIKGIPQHTADEPRTDCPTCKADGIMPMPAPRRSRTRKAA